MPHLEALWRREMPMGSYRPAWLPCTLADGRRVAALAFVMRRDVPSYTGKLSDQMVNTVLGCATGRYGTTLDYVNRTVAALRASGMPDRALEALLRRCEDQQRQTNTKSAAKSAAQPDAQTGAAAHSTPANTTRRNTGPERR
jgi:cation transport protein ChaC